MCEENWKVVKDYENYMISDYGRVFSILKNIMMKPYLEKNGYHRVQLCKDGNRNKFLIQQLVAIQYIDNPDNYKEVDHKDHNKTNNHFSNLRWCSRSQNTMNSLKRSGCSSGSKGVDWDKHANKWRARIYPDGKTTHLGLFGTEEEAFEAYKKAATSHQGEFTCFE